MKRISQKFYENTYHPGYKKKLPKGFLGKLFLILKKFEVYREDAVLDLLPYGNRLLDIGCGEGNLLLNAFSRFKDVYGIDVAKTRLAVAKRKINKLSKHKKTHVYLEFADADYRLPYKSDFFDAVTMIATLEHFFDPFHVISEVKRTLKAGAVLVIEVPNIGFLPRRLALLTGRLPITSEDEFGWDGGHLHYFTVNNLIDFLEKYNFKIESVTCSGIFASLRSWWASLLGADIIIKARKK